MSHLPNSYTAPSNFTIIQNLLIRSPELSCKAFKLLCIGLSHSGAWVFRKKQILTCFKEGEHTLDEAMKELRSLGYLHLIARKNSDGKMQGHIWYWFTEPMSEEEFKKFRRRGDFPDVGNFGGAEDHPGLRRSTLKNTNLKEKRMSVADDPVGSPPPKNLVNDSSKKSTIPKPENSSGAAKTSISIDTGGGTQQISQDELFRKAVNSKEAYRTDELIYAWNALAQYRGVVHDWWAYIKGTIANYRNTQKGKHAARSTNKKNRGSTNDNTQKVSRSRPREGISLGEMLDKAVNENNKKGKGE